MYVNILESTEYIFGLSTFLIIITSNETKEDNY